MSRATVTPPTSSVRCSRFPLGTAAELGFRCSADKKKPEFGDLFPITKVSRHQDLAATNAPSVAPYHCKELVINWHVTEACNFRCQYCYAKWHGEAGNRDLIHDSQQRERMLQAVFSFFNPDNVDNPLRRRLRWSAVRLNIAGGEPLLYSRKVIETIRSAREIGFGVSIITNASPADTTRMEEMAAHLTMIGVSIDSANDQISRAIGRVDRHGRTLSPSDLAAALAVGRKINPRLKVKLNTVVNALNWDHDMVDMVGSIAPERWKVLRVLPTVTDHLAVTDAQFRHFIDAHGALRSIMCPEDSSDMSESYLMIDPHGRFFQNALGRKGYTYSEAIGRVGVAKAFDQVRICAAKFASRYSASQVVAES